MEKVEKEVGECMRRKGEPGVWAWLPGELGSVRWEAQEEAQVSVQTAKVNVDRWRCVGFLRASRCSWLEDSLDLRV